GQRRRCSAASSPAAPETTNQPVIRHTPSRSHRSGLAVARPNIAQTNNAHATAPAPTTATRVPHTRLPDSAHTPARSILPPSSGSPGSTLNTPTAALATAHSNTSTQMTPPAGVASSSNPNSTASTSDTAGPAAATAASSRELRGVRAISARPPSRYNRNLRTGSRRRNATRQWPSSCANTDIPNRTANATASSHAAEAVTPASRSPRSEADNTTTTSEPVHQDGASTTGTPTSRNNTSPP